MRKTFLVATAAILLLLTVACGGNTEATQVPVEPAQQVTRPESEPEATREEPPPATLEVTEEATPEESSEIATEGDSESEPTEAMATDQAAPDVSTGPVATAEAGDLPINPDPVVPGEPFIILGTIINASLIPVDAPQFLIDGDNGVRYRVDAQPVADIFVEDGSQLLPHEYSPGLRVLATALLPADASQSDVATSNDLIILLSDK